MALIQMTYHAACHHIVLLGISKVPFDQKLPKEVLVLLDKASVLLKPFSRILAHLKVAAKYFSFVRWYTISLYFPWDGNER